MFLRSDHGTLCGSNNRNRIFLAEGFLDFVDRAGFSEGKSCCIFGAEENIYIRKNGFNAFSCFLTGSEIGTIVDIKGDQCSLFFEFFNTVNGKILCLSAKSECDSTCMEQACIVKKCLWHV